MDSMVLIENRRCGLLVFERDDTYDQYAIDFVDSDNASNLDK